MAYAIQPSLTHPQGHPISSLAFDPASDVLWTGTALGSVTANYPTFTAGVRFRASTKPLPVTRLSASDKDIKALTEGGIGAWGKGGVNRWFYQSSKPLSTFTDHPTMGTSAVLGMATAENPEFIVINTSSGAEVRRTPAPAMVTHLRATYGYLVSAASDGQIRTHDFRSSSRGSEGVTQSSVLAHAGGVQDLEVSGNYVYTCGWGYGQSRPSVDALVKVFDVRTMKTLPPIPFHNVQSGPMRVNVHPKRSTTVVITSAQGSICIVDLLNPVTGGEWHNLTVSSYITSTAFSPTGAYIALGDADGFIHLLGSGSPEERLPWNGFEGQPPPWMDHADSLPEIQWTNSTPLNSIGMPYYSTPLLSGSSSLLVPSGYYPPPAKIPEQVLKSMRVHDFVGYAALPRELRGTRNVVAKEVVSKDEGRFRSTQSKRKEEDETPEDINASASGYLRPEIPKHWRKTDIKYSKFGIEDFDFGYYNKTAYSGLESHIRNSYTNAIIQALHYTLPVREHAKSHITTSCQIEHCLLCELGFLSRMLEDAKGTNCQASNFCKVVGKKNQATALGLIDFSSESGAAPQEYATMIQQFNRFLMEEMTMEGNMSPNPSILPGSIVGGTVSPPSPITQLFGIQSKTVISCSNCGSTTDRTSLTHVVDLVYPRRAQPNEPSFSRANNLSELLSSSLHRETSYKATCQACRHTTNFSSRRVILPSALPPLLTVNAAAVSEDAVRLWTDRKVFNGTQRFTGVDVKVTFPPQALSSELDPADVDYQIRAMVVEVRLGPKASHLVAVVRVPDAGHQSIGSSSPWYLFNDFVVQNITEEEALGFPGMWKAPCVLFLERKDVIKKLDFSGLPSRLDPAILKEQISIAKNTDWAMQKHRVLAHDELPTPGTVVAIDAEFVALQQEETEIRSDGTKKVLRPSQLTLARVSVLRGAGPSSGTPFMDDYIHTTDTIVNYLTEFSGINFGDLDPATSRHTLLPLKAVYKKLRLLVDMGCIFIGHGLPKDFRIINLFVPPEQVIDTVDLYFLKERQRRLSLRFLSWYVLKEPIQGVTHDSIEDARAALLLYQKYQEFEEQKRFDEVLEEIYREGRKTNFKPPVDPDAPQSESLASPPMPPIHPAVGLPISSGFSMSHTAFHSPQPATPAAFDFLDTGLNRNFQPSPHRQSTQQWNSHHGQGHGHRSRR